MQRDERARGTQRMPQNGCTFGTLRKKTNQGKAKHSEKESTAVAETEACIGLAGGRGSVQELEIVTGEAWHS